MGLIENLLKRLFGKKAKSKVELFGKCLIIWVGRKSGDSFDSSGSYSLVKGKINIKEIAKKQYKSKDRLDFDLFDKLEIYPKTKTAIIIYKIKHNPLPPKQYIIKLFKRSKNNKIIELDKP